MAKAKYYVNVTKVTTVRYEVEVDAETSLEARNLIYDMTPAQVKRRGKNPIVVQDDIDIQPLWTVEK